MSVQDDIPKVLELITLHARALQDEMLLAKSRKDLTTKICDVSGVIFKYHRSAALGSCSRD
jgi:hypothetical protein